jgi:hypothetical protein
MLSGLGVERNGEAKGELPTYERILRCFRQMKREVAGIGAFVPVGGYAVEVLRGTVSLEN